MAGFILWMSGKWKEWNQANKRHWYDPKTEEDQQSFDQFIGARQ